MKRAAAGGLPAGDTLSRQREITWQLPREDAEAKLGTGNWKFFPLDRLPLVFESAARWKEALAGIDKPWLCWCIDDEWCWLQQRLVSQVGWTPVVGTDGRVAKPKLHKSAVFVNFNELFALPMMWMHFPLEFVFAFAPRLAYWHSDVLPPVEVMQRIAGRFASIAERELIGVRLDKVNPILVFQRILRRKPMFYKRWWEVVGCTTAGASQSQYEHGCGWWRNPQFHPQKSAQVERAKPFKEHGVGIYLWQTLFDGRAVDLGVDIQPYHYSTHQRGYQRDKDKRGRIAQSKHWELGESFDLDAIAAGLGLALAPAKKMDPVSEHHEIE